MFMAGEGGNDMRIHAGKELSGDEGVTEVILPIPPADLLFDPVKAALHGEPRPRVPL